MPPLSDFQHTDPEAHTDRRVIVDRRSEESTARWLDGVNRRHDHGRRFTDMAAEELDDHRDQPYSPCHWADVPTTGFL